MHRQGHRLGIVTSTYTDDNGKTHKRKYKSVIDPDGQPVDGEEHHSITFVWVPGCVHIDDHDPERHGTPAGQHVVLRGCDHGCDTYHLVEGSDPYHPSNFVTEDEWNEQQQPDRQQHDA